MTSSRNPSSKLSSIAASLRPYRRVLAILRTCITLLFWYCVSSTIILLTKWLFTNYFPYPLTVTTFSNTLTTFWALLIALIPRYRPQPITKKKFREYVLPIAISTALEIGCSNVALKILTVSFGTILKGGAPVFTMIWGLLLGVETFSANLCLSLITIAGGIALASFGEGHTFVISGFILQLCATALGGLRWAMTHVLLKGNPEAYMSPLDATLYTSPTTAACVLPVAILLEGSHVSERISELDGKDALKIFGTMFIVGTLVFILLVSEYWLVHATSSLALSVAGVFKELITIGGGIIMFDEKMSLLNIVGFIICQVGIGAYIWLRYDPKHTPGDHGEESEAQLPLAYTEVADSDEEDMKETEQPQHQSLELQTVQTVT